MVKKKTSYLEEQSIFLETIENLDTIELRSLMKSNSLTKKEKSHITIIILAKELAQAMIDGGFIDKIIDKIKSEK